MTKNQVDMIRAREQERSNREQERLEKRGQNMRLIGDVVKGTTRLMSGGLSDITKLVPTVETTHSIERRR